MTARTVTTGALMAAAGLTILAVALMAERPGLSATAAAGGLLLTVGARRSPADGGLSRALSVTVAIVAALSLALNAMVTTGLSVVTHDAEPGSVSPAAR